MSLIQGDQSKDMQKMQRQIGLDEPLTDPDVKKMASSSPAEKLTLAPPRPGQDQQQGGGKGGHRKRSGGKGHGKNGSRSGKSRGSGGQRSNSR